MTTTVLQTPKKTRRNAYLDNVKGVLIFLIVFTHLLEPSPHMYANGILRTGEIFTYIFHIPMFVLISGYLSRKWDTVDDVIKLVSFILVPYLAMQTFDGCFEYLANNNEKFGFSPFFPHQWLWYLLSLFFWRLFLPAATKIKLYLLWSFIAAVCIGFASQIGYFLSLSRTIVMLPFFLLGFALQKYEPEQIKELLPARMAVAVLLAGAAAAFAARWEDIRWLHHSSSYAALGLDAWYAPALRAVILAGGALIGLSFIRFLPQKESFLTVIGKNSFTIYIFHFYVRKLLLVMKCYALEIDWISFVFTALLLSLLSIYILTRNPVIFYSQIFSNPIGFVRNLQAKKTN